MERRLFKLERKPRVDKRHWVKLVEEAAVAVVGLPRRVGQVVRADEVAAATRLVGATDTHYRRPYVAEAMA